MDSYVSVVSPDRKGIIDNALATLNSINQSPIPLPKSISLLDILFGKRIMSTDNDIELNKALIDEYENIEAIDYQKVLSWVRNKVETHINEYIAD